MAFDGHTKKKIHDMEKFKYSTACKVGNAIENNVEQVYLEKHQPS